jgi:hypothetical protein
MRLSHLQVCGLAIAVGVCAVDVAHARRPNGSGETPTWANITGTLVLTSYEVTLKTPAGVPIPEGTEVDLVYTRPNGTPQPVTIGYKAKVGPNGVLKVPPHTQPPPLPPPAPQTPPGIPNPANQLGGKVEIKVPGEPASQSCTLMWYNANINKQGKQQYPSQPKLEIDDGGDLLQLPFVPGQTNHWKQVINPIPTTIRTSSAEFGVENLSILATGFDLRIAATPTFGNVYDVTVAGDNSFMRLSSNVYMSFPDGMSVGQIEIPPTANAGTFNLSGLGLAGTWNQVPGKGLVTTVTTLSEFADIPTIRVVPGPWALHVALLGGVLAYRRTRREGLPE